MEEKKKQFKRMQKKQTKAIKKNKQLKTWTI